MSHSSSVLSGTMPSKITNDLVRAMYLKNLEKIDEVVKANPEFDVTMRVNSQKKNSVLHMATMLDSHPMLEYFLTLVRS